jgi:hypothetical protein
MIRLKVARGVSTYSGTPVAMGDANLPHRYQRKLIEAYRTMGLLVEVARVRT